MKMALKGAQPIQVLLKSMMICIPFTFPFWKVKTAVDKNKKVKNKKKHNKNFMLNLPKTYDHKNLILLLFMTLTRISKLVLTVCNSVFTRRPF